MIVFAIILILLALAAQELSSRNGLKDIRADFYPERNVAEPDEDFYLHITLKNTGHRFLPFLRFTLFFQAEIRPQDLSHCHADHYDRGCTFSRTTHLLPHRQTDFRIPVRIDTRGRYVFRPLTVSTGDFLGLKEEPYTFSFFREVVIAPREAPQMQIDTAMGGLMGDIQVRRFLYEDPVLTAGFREYTGQEPMKKISWMQSAKGRGLMVKNDDFTAEPTVSVILNVDIGVFSERPVSGEETHESSRTDDQTPFEQCLSLTRTVCRMLEDRRIPYDLNTNAVSAGGWYDENDRCILRGFGAVHFGKVLELLGRATDTVTVSGNEMIRKIADSRTVCGRILITPASGMPDPESLQRLREVSDGMLLILTAEEKKEADKI